MKRMVAALAGAALLAAISVGATLAAPYEADDTPQPAWSCPAWSGSFGNYDPSTNPTLKTVADKLGIGADALANELKSGKSIADLAASKNVDLQSLVDTVTAPQKEMMAIRVKYGYLTQAQADQAIQNMASVMKSRFEQKGFFGGFGGMMGGGSRPGGFGPGMMGGGFGPGARGGVGPGTVTPGAGQSYGPGMMGRGFGGMMGGWQTR